MGQKKSGGGGGGGGGTTARRRRAGRSAGSAQGGGGKKAEGRNPSSSSAAVAAPDDDEDDTDVVVAVKGKGKGKKGLIRRRPPLKSTMTIKNPIDELWSSVLPPPLLSLLSSYPLVVGPSLLFAAAFVAYYPSLINGGYIWDDRIFVDAPQVTSGFRDGLVRLWTEPGSVKQEVHYWPVIYSTFWLEHKLFVGLLGGGDGGGGGFDSRHAPAIMRFANLVLHVINGLLVKDVLVNRIGRSTMEGWLSAFVFVLHPVRVESVAWIIERKDILSGTFYLLALRVHPNSYPNDGLLLGLKGSKGERMTETKRRRRRWRAVVLSTILYVLGLLTKTAAVSLPVVLLVLPWLHRGIVRFRRDVVPTLPLFVAGVCIVLFDMSIDSRSNVGFGYTLVQRLFIGTRAVCFYLGKLFWPTDLMMIYPRWIVNPAVTDNTDTDNNGDTDNIGEPRYIWYLSFAFVSTLLLVLWLARNVPRMGRGPLAAMLYFGACLGPSLGLVDYSYMQYSFVADRFQYLAGIGPIAVACAAFVRGFGGAGTTATATTTTAATGAGAATTAKKTTSVGARRVAAALLLCIVATLGILTNRHSYHFLDDHTYFAHVVTSNPTSCVGWKHLADHHVRVGETQLAVEAFTRAAELVGTDGGLPPHIVKVQGRMYRKDLGKQLTKLGRYDDAEVELRRALEYDPHYDRTYVALGNVLSDAGRREEAADAFRRATDIEPRTNAVAWGNLGAELGRLGRREEAVGPLRQAVRLDPRGAYNPRVNLGIILYELGRYEEARDVLDEAVRLRPVRGSDRAREFMEKAAAKIEEGKKDE